MNSSINYSGFVEMFLESNDDFEPYGCTDANESMEDMHRNLQSHKAGISNWEGMHDE